MRGSQSYAFLLVFCLLPVAGCAHHHHHHHGEGRIGMDDLPPNVRDHFNRDHPDMAVKGIESDTQQGVTHYGIKYEDHDGLMHESFYDREGDEIDPDAKLP
jgi:hypothetical protein